PANTSTSGCQPADYDAAGFKPGDVALLQRGTCTFDDKLALAINRGASAVVLFNEGQAPDRVSFSFGVLGSVAADGFGGIPVLSTTYTIGFELYNLTRSAPVTVQVVTKTSNILVFPPGTLKNNSFTNNVGAGNSIDATDRNMNPPCGGNAWSANIFDTVN